MSVDKLTQSQNFSNFLTKHGLTHSIIGLEGVVDQPEQFNGGVRTPNGTIILFATTRVNAEGVPQAIDNITQLIHGISQEVKSEGLIVVDFIEGVELIGGIGAAMSADLNTKVKQQLAAIGYGNVLVTVVEADTSNPFAKMVLTGTANMYNRVNHDSNSGSVALTTNGLLAGTLADAVEKVEQSRRDQ